MTSGFGNNGLLDQLSQANKYESNFRISSGSPQDSNVSKVFPLNNLNNNLYGQGSGSDSNTPLITPNSLNTLVQGSQAKDLSQAHVNSLFDCI